VRVFLILLGLLLILGGGAVAAAQYAPPNLLAMLDSAPQARDFLMTQTALYAGAGGAGFGLLLLIIGAVTGGKRKKAAVAAATIRGGTVPYSEAQEPSPKAPVGNATKLTSVPTQAAAEPLKTARAEPRSVGATPAPAPTQAAAPKQPEPKPPEQRPAPVAAAPPPPLRPAPALAPAAAPVAAAAADAPKPKPQASAQPPAPTQAPEAAQISMADAARVDPRLVNRKRVQDLVTINDALKSYHKAHGAYPVAPGLGGILDRGAAWIPGLADILPDLPRDPAMSMDRDGPQYVYASDGKDYKLIALNISLVGSTNPAVLGIRIDPTRNPTQENAAFGFWTEGFASA
jgi:hypothetical protein